MGSTLQTLSSSIDHWQILYLLSIVIALLSTFAIVVFAFHIQEHRWGLKVSNYVYVVFSLLAVVSTIVIVVKTKSLDTEKDRAIKISSEANDLKIAKANVEAQSAYDKAEQARVKADEIEKENTRLKTDLARETGIARNAESGLSRQNQQTYEYAHSVATAQASQQNAMAERAKVSPVLTEFQIQQLAASLAPYSGREVVFHVTPDTVVARLGFSIKRALDIANIKSSAITDVGMLYQGVSIVIHDPKSVPPLADAIGLGLRQAGLSIRAANNPNLVPEGTVGIFIGPN